jgi:anaerobic selenocysteine-containing dehydrogenase
LARGKAIRFQLADRSTPPHYVQRLKEFDMTVQVNQEIRPSVCPLDCPDTCSLAVTVEGDRLIEVKGSRANPYTNGAICSKVAKSYPEMVHGSDRLQHPLRRVGARGERDFERISWEAALDIVHEGMSAAIDKFGPQSVLPFNYAGPHGQLAGGSMDRRFFHKMGASLLSRAPLCGAVKGTAYASLFGSSAGMPADQALDADLIVIWGNNVTVSNLHFTKVVQSARARGAKVVVVDPKRIKIAEQSDLLLQLQPGTDVVLALALASELERRGKLDMAFIERFTVGFDQYMAEARKYSAKDVVAICKLTEQEFDTLVQLYVNAKNVATSIGNGIERGRSGGSGLRAAMALQALTGNHGRRGTGVISKQGLAAPKTTDKLQRPDLVPDGTRTINIVDVPEMLLDKSVDPRLAAIMIYNHNPVSTHPNQIKMIEALKREDLFIVGCDIVMNDSMLFADVILPAVSHFEHDDIYGAYGQHYVQRAAPAIPCVGESLPNTEIFRRLAARFGYDDPIFTENDAELMDAAIDGEDPRMQGYKPSNLPLDRALEMTAEGGGELIMCDTVMPTTPSGKIELFSADLEHRFGYGVPRFEAVAKTRSYVLITPSSSKRTNATFGGCEESKGLEILELHPDDAAANGIKSGDVVTVSNDLGAVTLKALISDAVRPGVFYSPKGAWFRSSPTGMTTNALIPTDIRADIERGACYNETFVDIATGHAEVDGALHL